MSFYTHLGLATWPFQTVPTRESATYLADRTQLNADLHLLIRGLTRRDSSSINVFWSWFGAGKTHTLFYLDHLLSEYDRSEFPMFHTVYSEFPRSPTGFLDVYRAFMNSIPLPELADAYLEVATAGGLEVEARRLQEASLDLHAALRVLATGEEGAAGIAG